MLFLLLAVILSELLEKPRRQDRVTEKCMGAMGGILCDDVMRKRSKKCKFLQFSTSWLASLRM